VLFPISRVVALLMAGVLCFAILVPLALARHVPSLAIFITVIFIAYLIANVILWLRMRPRA
jgi:hypothetical protein